MFGVKHSKGYSIFNLKQSKLGEMIFSLVELFQGKNGVKRGFCKNMVFTHKDFDKNVIACDEKGRLIILRQYMSSVNRIITHVDG